MSLAFSCEHPKVVFGCVNKLKPFLEEATEIAGMLVVVSLGA